MTTSNKPEYNSWRGMKERCSNPNHIGYKYYGGRGIKVCSRWMESFEKFLEDMGSKPAVGYQIDRINVDGNYERENCRWATPRDQRINQRPYDESKRVLSAWKNRKRVSKGRIELSGKVFGRLLVLSFSKTMENRAFWLCKCDCGNTAVVCGKSLRGGKTKSCGCLNRQIARERAIIRNKKGSQYEP